MNQKTVSLIMNTLKATAVTFLALLPMSQSQAGFNDMNQRYFTAGVESMMNTLIQQGADQISVLPRPMTLEHLKAQVHVIQYTQSTNLVATKGLSCTGSLEAQWLTSQDNSSGKVPLVFSKSNDFQNFNGDSWRLMLHEAVSSLGVVDDEYQFTGPLLTLQAEAQIQGRSIADIANTAEFRPLAEVLKQTQMRTSAPHFSADSTEHCYNNQDQLVPRALNQNTTGIGGGGDHNSLSFKIGLIADAPKWWKKNANAKNKSYTDFLKKISAMGVEPNPIIENSGGEISQENVQFIRSKRTGKITAYLMLWALVGDNAPDWTAAHLEASKEVVYRWVYKNL